MISLSPTDAARIALSLVQYLRQETEAGANFTVANLATLLAVCENPGSLQPDIAKAVGGVGEGTLTRHLNMLSGIGRTADAAQMPALTRTERNVQSRRLNDVFLTPEGESFAAGLAKYFSRLLSRTLERK